MRLNLLLSLLVAALLTAACFMPWITVESKAITITGVDTTGTQFGKPAYFHFLWAGLCVLFLLINKVWAKRVALLFAAFNLAWAVRNFFLIPACAGGECPAKKVGLYLMFLSSLLLFFMPMMGKSESVKEPTS